MTNFSISRETSTNHNLSRDVNRILNSWTIGGGGEGILYLLKMQV